MDGHSNNGNNTNNNLNINNSNYRKYKRGNSNPKTKKQLENELYRQRSFFVGSPQNQSSHNAQVSIALTTNWDLILLIIIPRQ